MSVSLLEQERDRHPALAVDQATCSRSCQAAAAADAEIEQLLGTGDAPRIVEGLGAPPHLVPDVTASPMRGKNVLSI